MADIALRFDIDTVSCIETGVRELLDMAADFDVPMSFYVNMGRSFNLRNAIRRFKHPSARSDVPKLSPYAKLGPTHLAKTLLRNPEIGAENLGMLDRILDAGHELGLHGCMDHTEWQHFLPRELNDDFRESFDRAYALFSSRFGEPAAFCCPGFRHNGAAYRLLEEYRFTYTSDTTSLERPGPARLGEDTFGFDQVPVSLIGPGTVPLIEHCYASGRPITDVTSSIAATLEQTGWGVLYGHPCFEGKRGANMLRECLRRLAPGHSFFTVDDVRRRFRTDS